MRTCVVFQDLLGSMGLMSANILEQHSAISSLSTLMSIIPNDTFLEFEKVSCEWFQYLLTFFFLLVLLSTFLFQHSPFSAASKRASRSDVSWHSFRKWHQGDANAHPCNRSLSNSNMLPPYFHLIMILYYELSFFIKQQVATINQSLKCNGISLSSSSSCVLCLDCLICGIFL